MSAVLEAEGIEALRADVGAIRGEWANAFDSLGTGLLAPATEANMATLRARGAVVVLDSRVTGLLELQNGQLTPLEQRTRGLEDRVRALEQLGPVVNRIATDLHVAQSCLHLAETSRMTTLSDPTYVDEGVVHYAAPNLPALVARTATFALAAATLPYVTALADAGVANALASHAGLAAGAMVWDGAITHGGLATDAGRRQVVAPWRRQSARVHESAVGRIAGEP